MHAYASKSMQTQQTDCKHSLLLYYYHPQESKKGRRPVWCPTISFFSWFQVVKSPLHIKKNIYIHSAPTLTHSNTMRKKALCTETHSQIQMMNEDGVAVGRCSFSPASCRAGPICADQSGVTFTPGADKGQDATRAFGGRRRGHSRAQYKLEHMWTLETTGCEAKKAKSPSD